MTTCLTFMTFSNSLMLPLLSVLGGFYKGRWFAARWPPELAGLCQVASSALYEIYPIVVAAILWGNEWSRKSILIYSDNLVVVDIINERCSNSPSIMPFMRHLTRHSFTHQYILCAAHVPSHSNAIADSDSFLVPEVLKLGTSHRYQSNTNSSIFGADLQSINPTLIPLIVNSQYTIITSVSPSTLSSYSTAWRNFHHFHDQHNITFPLFDLVTLTCFHNICPFHDGY